MLIPIGASKKKFTYKEIVDFYNTIADTTSWSISVYSRTKTPWHKVKDDFYGIYVKPIFVYETLFFFPVTTPSPEIDIPLIKATNFLIKIMEQEDEKDFK